MNFFDFFPPPSYLKMPAIGLDISDRSLKYVGLRRFGKNIRLAAFGRKDIPPGMIEAGQIKKQNEFAEFLKYFRKEIKNNRLIAALPEEKTFIGTIQLPPMKEEEIRGALELQLEEHIPLQIKEAIFDYEVALEAEPQSRLDISFAAVDGGLAKSYRDVLTSAGFTPFVFETEPHALTRALIRPEEKRAQMVIDFGKTRTSFFISDGVRIKISSTIKVAGETLDLAISKVFSVSPEEGRRLKNEKGLLKTKENEKFFSAILPVVSAIKGEAGRHLSYWKSHAPGGEGTNKEIENIILCGGDSNLKGLSEYLAAELGAVVQLGNPWINVASFEDYVPEIELRESQIYATAIGLALRGL